MGYFSNITSSIELRSARHPHPNPLPQAGEGVIGSALQLPSPVYGRGVRLSERSELSRSGEGGNIAALSAVALAKAEAVRGTGCATGKEFYETY